MRLWNLPVSELLNLNTEEPCWILSTMTVQSGQEGATLKRILGQECEHDSMCREVTPHLSLFVCVCVYTGLYACMCVDIRGQSWVPFFWSGSPCYLRQGLSLARISLIRQSQLASESKRSVKPPPPLLCWVSNAHHHKKVGLFTFFEIGSGNQTFSIFPPLQGEKMYVHVCGD